MSENTTNNRVAEGNMAHENAMPDKPHKRGKEERILLRVLIVLLVIPATIIASLIVVSKMDTTGNVYNKMTIKFMPESLNTADYGDSAIKLKDGSTLVLYVELNPDFDQKKMAPLDAYRVYYKEKDENGKWQKIYLKDGKYDNGEDIISDARISFLMLASNKRDAFKKNLIKVLFVYFAVAGVIFIRFWFLSWSRREDEKAEWQRLANEQSMERNKQRKSKNN